ncbi:heterokaryon incompatibility protein-domain-containing protein, partial [Phyllosticta citrichinensis]
PVHESLWRFLHWAWNQRMCSTWIWTDKICLNQKDGTEKDQQIPRMCDIFQQNAEKVLAWLDMTEGEGNHLVPAMDFGMYEQRPFQILDEVPVETMNAVMKLSDLGYWSRVWIVQECAIAKKVV